MRERVDKALAFRRASVLTVMACCATAAGCAGESPQLGIRMERDLRATDAFAPPRADMLTGDPFPRQPTGQQIPGQHSRIPRTDRPSGDSGTPNRDPDKAPPPHSPAAGDEDAEEVVAPSTTIPPAPAPIDPPIDRPAYTAPSAAVRQLALAATASVAGYTKVESNPGSEVTESLAFSGQGPIGRLGVTAPPTAVANAVIGRQGIARGQLVGLGFATPNSNLFTLGVNPLTGVNGRCAEMTRIGFFGGNQAQCELSFRR